MTKARALAEQIIYKLGHRDIDWKCCISDEGAVAILTAALAQAQRETWEQAALLGQEMIDAYPVDVFIEPPKGQHGETIDACSARDGRHLGKVFRDRCRQQGGGA